MKLTDFTRDLHRHITHWESMNYLRFKDLNLGAYEWLALFNDYLYETDEIAEAKGADGEREPRSEEKAGEGRQGVDDAEPAD